MGHEFGRLPMVYGVDTLCGAYDAGQLPGNPVKGLADLAHPTHGCPAAAGHHHVAGHVVVVYGAAFFATGRSHCH